MFFFVVRCYVVLCIVCYVLFVVGAVVRGVWSVPCRLFCDVGICCVICMCVLFLVGCVLLLPVVC